mmetsp:Transcript_13015/g.24849  ORF Transcript_13015/g.24849 Transcript_13015/m.24849 type:complete len:85 (-) Transcript_13015:32-286(-)
MAMAAFTCKVARRALVVRVAAAPALWRSKARGFKHGPARLVRRQEEVELCICISDKLVLSTAEARLARLAMLARLALPAGVEEV